MHFINTWEMLMFKNSKMMILVGWQEKYPLIKCLESRSPRKSPDLCLLAFYVFHFIFQISFGLFLSYSSSSSKSFFGLLNFHGINACECMQRERERRNKFLMDFYDVFCSWLEFLTSLGRKKVLITFSFLYFHSARA